MNKFEIFIIVTSLPHIILAVITQMIILKTTKLNPNQKIINTILNWVIPYVWGFIIRKMIKEPVLKVYTKQNRKRNSNSNTDNWKTLTGFGDGV
ncbi:hypothetical protein [Reichenbachiella versicolor]|uniref:hypothetical protein n=1 Tax=Reichenbachiella versicolor TaxID=1821036 RepID=UPI000D6E0FB9|nr:hypothetical protein [Reichenbachiella versicolor]